MTEGIRKKHGEKTSTEPIRIEPIPFRSGRPPRKVKPVALAKGLAGVLFGAALILLCASVWFVFTARQVVIAITPVPERISIYGGVFTPRVGDYYLMRPGKYRLTAFKACFHPLDRAFQIDSEKHQSLNFKMREQPGRLTVRAHRPGDTETRITDARVFVDGAEVGRTPLEGLETAKGLRRLEIRAENYQDVKRAVDVVGCNTLQTLNLAMLPGWSNIAVNSVPPGAEVKVDGTSLGITPLRVQLAAGTYTMEVTADLHKTWARSLVVKPNDPQEITDIRLQPADGKLTITTDPAGANVMIAGVFVGQTPLVTDLSPSEEHVIHISKAGYEKTTRNIRISPDESKQLKVSLKPVEGTVHLMVEPPDAELLVDGRSIGVAPKELRLVAVEQTLEFRKKGYRSYRTRITPQPGFPKQLKIALTGEETPEKAPAGSITTKTGYRLNLIHPGPILMGSSRREQGRRANETLRKIDLKRPFYMGLREVTNKEFKEFMHLHNSGIFKSERLNDADQPAVRVTWEEAARFCNWLSEKESLPPAYLEEGDALVAADPLNTGYRLPTEAEWEYCARYADKQPLLKYPWGQNFPPERSSGNFSDQSAKDLLSNIIEGYNDGYAVAAPPAKFNPNRLGLYDMGGNVAEWCSDYYTLYSYDPEKTYVDPGGPREGKHHVIRGSSWQNGSIGTLRLAYRGYGNARREDVGFRVCRYLE